MEQVGIEGSYSRLLAGKKVVVGVTGGIAAYRAIDLVRQLIRHGANVRVVMSEKAVKLIGPEVFRWASGRKPLTEFTGRAEHISVCSKADVLVVVPATANTIGKIAHGIADTTVTLCAMAALGGGAKVMVVPSMNYSLWVSPFFSEALERLRKKEFEVVEPIIEEGRAKLPPIEEVVECVIDATAPKDMRGLKVLVTAGPTREYIDEVKYVTTPSSGLTGIYFAREARARGADVTLVVGPVGIPIRVGAEVVRVIGVEEMYEKAVALANKFNYDVVVLAAAPLDFAVSKVPGKLSSDLEEVHLVLRRAPKISKDIRSRLPNAVIVGFKAEVNIGEQELVERARRRMEEGGWDLAIAHDVSKMGFGTLHDSYILLHRDGSVERLGPAHKRELAREVLSRVVGLLKR